MANSSAIFSRAHTWGATDTVLQTDLNNEFNNILNNFTPAMMGGYSFNVAQMQIQTSPGAVGTESLAAALSGELERIRYQISAIQGTTFWYQTASSSIAQLTTALGSNLLANRVSSGVSTTAGQPTFLIPDGTTNRLTLATSTPFVYSISGTQYTISSNITLSGLTTAAVSAAATVCLVNDTSITAGAAYTQLIGENGSVITVATAGSAISAIVGKIGAFKNLTSGELFIARVASTTALMDCSRGYFQTSSSAFATRSGLTNGDQLELMSLAWIYATTAGTLNAVYTNPSYQGVAPGSPSIGDYWLNMTTNVWETYNGSTWITANATLVGVAVMDTSKCVGVRCNDYYANYSSVNTVEIFDSSSDTTNAMRSRYKGAQISVYGTSLNFSQAYVTWNATGTGLIDSTTLTTGNSYYFYISPQGSTYCTSVAPFNRQSDLLGYYHPSNPYRCVGFAVCATSGSQTFGEIESFFRDDNMASTSAITAAASYFPVPYNAQSSEQFIACNASGGAFTQVIPPASSWKGKRLIYMKTDSSSNAVTLQAWGNSLLTTTATVTLGNTTISTLAATTGLVASAPYLISGTGINPGTTVTWASGATAVLSQNSYQTAAPTVTFAQVPNVTFVSNPLAGINGNFTTTLNTLNESVELISDGIACYVVDRYIPSVWANAGVTTITATSVNPAKGTVSADNSWWRRVGENMEVRQEFVWTGSGSAGTGDYLFTLPASYSADTYRCTIYNGSTPVEPANVIGSGIVGNSAGNQAAQVVLYSATKYRIYGSQTTNTFVSAGLLPLSGSNGSYSVTLSVPILGWNG